MSNVNCRIKVLEFAQSFCQLFCMHENFNNKVLDKKRQWQCSVILPINETLTRARARTVPTEVGSAGTRE